MINYINIDSVIRNLNIVVFHVMDGWVYAMHKKNVTIKFRHCLIKYEDKQRYWQNEVASNTYAATTIKVNKSQKPPTKLFHCVSKRNSKTNWKEKRVRDIKTNEKKIVAVNNWSPAIKFSFGNKQYCTR